MTILATDALGHIGSHLVRMLPHHFPDENVVMIDNMSIQRYASLFRLPSEGNYRFIEADVTNTPPALREFAMTGYVTGPDTLVPGICQLESGEVRVWHSGAAQVDRAWSYRHWPITQCRINPRRNRRTPVRGN